jgi:hypothetical protein
MANCCAKRRSRRALFLAGGLALALAACGPAPTGQAPAPQSNPASPIAKTREQLAIEVFEVGGMREQMLKAVRAAVVQSAGDSRLNPIIDEELKAAIGPVADQAAKIYAEEFNAQELTDMAAFFATPGGKAFLARQGKLQDRLQPIGQRFGQDLLLRVVQKAQNQGLLPGAASSPPAPDPAAKAAPSAPKNAPEKSPAEKK